MISRTALIVVDVQDGIANLTDGVPDADEVTQAISSILRDARLHNGIQITHYESKRMVEIVFVQHDDKNPEEPLYRGKATWNLVFPPQQSAEHERLVSKDVGKYKSGGSYYHMTNLSLGDMFRSNPDLAASLRGQDVRHLVFVGLQTDFCVRASILGAIASGFDPSDIILLQGAHSTYDNISTGESYRQIEENVEKQLTNLGVRLQHWENFVL
jgi:nicotinamidase-related amidase